jgi:hypothetical protein
MTFDIDPTLYAALALLAGIVVPVVTAFVTAPTTDKRVKRWLPIGLSAAGALVLAFFGGAFGPVPEAVATVVLTAAAVAGTAQAVYALTPATWRGLSEATSKPSEG